MSLTPSAFRIPLQIAIAGATGQPRIERVEVAEASSRFTFAAGDEPASVALDPNTWVLMQVESFSKR